MFKGQELQYPVDWHFRIITENSAHPQVIQEIKDILTKFNVSNSLAIGNESGQGKYVSYTVTVSCPDRQYMDDIAAAFGAVPGVKMVL